MAFTTILLTAVLTAAGTQGTIWLKDRWYQSRDAKFSALYAALFLEQYATDCSKGLSDIQHHEEYYGGLGSHNISLPPLPPFPNEIDWKSTGIKLTEATFAFRVAVEAMNSKINFLHAFDPPDGGDYEVEKQLIELGLQALKVAGRLRKSAKLGPAHVPDPDNTIAHHLQSLKRSMDDRIANFIAGQATSLGTLTDSEVSLPV